MISILIAVYNTAQYLPQCLDSLKAQTHTDFEAICIDDASTDASAAVLDRYAAEDKRFRVIHLMENGGQAKARNIGLREARGEWVTMLDSDDWFAPDTLEQTLATAAMHDDTDCVLLRCRLVYPDGREDEMPLCRAEWTPQQALADAISWQGIHGLYLLRTEIHRRYPFDETTMLYSDDNTSRLHFLHSRRIVASGGTYYYRQHSASTTHVVSLRHFDLVAALASLQRTLQAEPLADSAVRQTLVNHRWYVLTDMWHYYFTNRGVFSAEKEIIMDILRLSYQELIDQRITSPLRRRLGYLPLRPYWLYVAQVKLYFRLRNLLGR